MISASLHTYFTPCCRVRLSPQYNLAFRTDYVLPADGWHAECNLWQKIRNQHNRSQSIMVDLQSHDLSPLPPKSGSQ